MGKPLRYRTLDRALQYLGVTEDPPGSNRGRFIDAWNRGAGVPVGSYWCCSFVHGMYDREGFALPGGASVYYLKEAGRKHGWIVDRPRRGDIVCFEFGEGAWAYDDHVGIVERTLALRWTRGRFTGWLASVEGNTSAQGKTGSQSNGGGVFRRRRWVRGIGATFIRVPG